MRCSAGTCMTSQADPKLVLAAERRLRRLSRQRRLLNSSQPEPLLIFTPVPPATASPIVAYDLAPKAFASGRVGGGESWAERAIEQRAYESTFGGDYFMYDSLHVYRTFFPGKRDGFVLEVGGLDGAASLSNSYFYERYLGWRVLMVEASPLNFAKLFTRRPAAFRLEGALGEAHQTLRFSGHGCCGSLLKGGADSYLVRSVPIGAVLRALGVERLDFWSLDVEGAELAVLKGMDWSIPVSVLLIESVNDPIRALLRSRGFEHHPHESPSRLNEIWVRHELSHAKQKGAGALVASARRRGNAALPSAAVSRGFAFCLLACLLCVCVAVASLCHDGAF